jgi:hypothetical protein
MREQNYHCRCMNRCTGLKGVKSLGGGWAASFAVASSVYKQKNEFRSYFLEEISVNPSSRDLYQGNTRC